MRALISGQAGLGLLFDEGRAYSFSVEFPEPRIVDNPSNVVMILRDSRDLRELDRVTRDHAVQELELAWYRDRGLQLSLILLDREEPIDVRREAVGALDECLEQPGVGEFIGDHLYSAPLPRTADLAGALGYAAEVKCTRASAFLLRLQSDQVEISARCEAWSRLGVTLFESAEEEGRFRAEAVRAGAFRLFVQERRRGDWALFQLLADPRFRGRARARGVFQQWAAPFRQSIVGTSFPVREEVEKEVTSTVEDVRRRRWLRGREVFQQVEKQKNAIKGLLERGNRELALRYTEDLISVQRADSEREHVAKSLCDLAQFAKRLGSAEVQLEFALRAIAEVPDDGWSHGTVGDAYRGVGEYQKALDAFHQAGVYGQVRSALLGRAEVLRDLGQLEEALQIFERCAAEFPEDIVSRNGRASALASSGRLEEALEAYDQLLRGPLFDSVSLTGRAEVLRDMGLLEEALEAFGAVVRDFPGEIIPRHARAEVLRELGRLSEAKEAFEAVCQQFPLSASGWTGVAKVLRDMGCFTEAAEEFKRITDVFPWDLTAYLALAETSKRQGQLTAAQTAYQEVLDRFPRNSTARNGLAAVEVALGDYDSAISRLPRGLPATVSEWVAYHIKGMAYLRSGQLQSALEIFEWGVQIQENPWSWQREYFKTALASARVQQRRYEEAVALVRDIGQVALKPVSHLVEMHAYGELGRQQEAAAAYEAIKDTASPVVLDLREILAERYVARKSRLSRTDTWVFSRECDALLLAA
jgi:tetratricopeptide (TPR) repeat protein